MNKKEKAKEIYCKYADALNIRDLRATSNPFVKQCSLIAVDEIIEYLTTSIDIMTNLSAVEYWDDVKLELHSL
jgi:hypothetical protein